MGLFEDLSVGVGVDYVEVEDVDAGVIASPVSHRFATCIVSMGVADVEVADVEAVVVVDRVIAMFEGLR